MMPIIALPPQISPKHGTAYMNHEYCDAIIRAGGLPLILPLSADKAILRRYADMCQGLFLTGGHDISPAIYGEDTRPDCGEVVVQRDEMELGLLELFMEADKPVLGVCRGIQLINAQLGGTLYQHIPAQFETSVNHNQKPPYGATCHYVNLFGNLTELLGVKKLPVNSLHHQAVKDLAPGLEVTALSEDTLAEAFYLPGKGFSMLSNGIPRRWTMQPPLPCSALSLTPAADDCNICQSPVCSSQKNNYFSQKYI